MYYIHEATVAVKEKGVKHTVILLTGEKKTLQITQECSRIAKVEAAAAVVDKETGKVRVGALIGNVWHELPEGAFGIGNRKNPLVPWVHVAADQRLYPFGSRVFMPSAVGYKTPEGRVLDGYFWVADAGSAIKGRLRFDLFVGHDAIYTEMMARRRLAKPGIECYVEKLPKVPDKISPSTPQGMHELLIRLGCLRAPGVEGFSPHAFMVIPDEMRDALVVFQKRYSEIPPAEYGNPLGATTLWFLTKAAQELSGKK
jgi:3D (Asp-Asp-Asp) domain-containing protein